MMQRLLSVFSPQTQAMMVNAERRVVDDIDDRSWIGGHDAGYYNAHRGKPLLTASHSPHLWLIKPALSPL